MWGKIQSYLKRLHYIIFEKGHKVIYYYKSLPILKVFLLLIVHSVVVCVQLSDVEMFPFFSISFTGPINLKSSSSKQEHWSQKAPAVKKNNGTQKLQIKLKKIEAKSSNSSQKYIFGAKKL